MCFFFSSHVSFVRPSDGPAAHRPGARLGRDRGGNRPAGLLSVGGMGHHGRAGGQAREVLRVLRGTVPGHILQHHAQAEDAVLHGQPDHTVRGHIVPVRVGVLPAVRVRREGVAVHIHTAVAHRVLPAAGRDHTAHVAHRAAARQIPAVHHGPGHAVRVRHRRRIERQFQVGRETKKNHNTYHPHHPPNAKFKLPFF